MLRNNKKRGIALVEIVVALILLTIYIIFNTALYYDAYTNVKEVQQYTIATNILIKTAETVKGQSYEDVVDWDDTFSTTTYLYNIDVNVSTATYNTFEYKMANVRISWGETNSISVDILKYNPPVFEPVEPVTE